MNINILRRYTNPELFALAVTFLTGMLFGLLLSRPPVGYAQTEQGMTPRRLAEIQANRLENQAELSRIRAEKAKLALGRAEQLGRMRNRIDAARVKLEDAIAKGDDQPNSPNFPLYRAMEKQMRMEQEFAADLAAQVKEEEPKVLQVEPMSPSQLVSASDAAGISCIIGQDGNPICFVLTKN